MKIAQGSISWILATFIAFLIFLILTFLSNQSEMQFIFLFVTVVLFFKIIIVIIFFRDPERIIGNGIIACADGRIREISKVKDDDVGDCTKISTFMNIYNVHVNRIPFNGAVKDIIHKNGIHLPAFKKESEKNERVITIIDTDIGTIKVIQIAGTLARRISPYIKKGDKLKKGEKIGIIKFGSRVDVYLPNIKIKKIRIKVGDMVKAGETTLAEIND
jgi:phosphatidylserine decarboxylase